MTLQQLEGYRALLVEIDAIERDIKRLHLVSDIVVGSSVEHPYTKHTICVTGIPASAQDMLDMMNAKLSVGRHMEDVYTVYAYNKGIKNYIMIGKDKVNVNICIGYDEEKNETTVYLATPMNMQDY